MIPERRRYRRYDIMACVRLRRGTNNYVLDVTNISLSGVFVSTLGLPRTDQFSVGQTLELHIFLPGAEENVRATGRIVRMVERENPPARGFGLELLDATDETRAGISRLIEVTRSSEIPQPPPLPTTPPPETV